MRWMVLLVVGGCAARAGSPAFSPPGSCDQAEYHGLDFWLGDWKVVNPQGGAEGTNHIEAILGGCAVREQWTEAVSGKGESLFYYDRSLRRWKQVWVTTEGAWKEKTQVEGPPGTVRFQGTLPRPRGSVVLDRTTLTPISDGGVRQVIELSTDGGNTWQTWVGIYRRS